MKKVVYIILVATLAVWSFQATAHGYSIDNSSLTQSVQPITCVYTITQNGSSTSTSTACDSVVAPTLESSSPRAGRPILSGAFQSADLDLLRVWVGGQWYTLGIGDELTINGEVWKLDLSGLGTPLPSGTYTIVIEQLTTTDFLLRSIYPDALIVPVVDIVRTDTSVGKGTVTDLVPSSGSQIYPWLLPEDYPQLEWRAGESGQPLKLDVGTFYTSDTVVTRSANPLQQLALVAGVALVGWFALFRTGLLARWTNK